MATGAIVGGLLGGALGGIPSLGMGTGMGYALGSSLGGMVEGQALWSKAQNKQIPETDPRMTLLLNEIRQKRAGLESGQFYQPQQDMIRQAGAQALGTAAGITGGDIGATVSALSAINRGTGRNLNELYGGMMNQSLNMSQQEQALAQYLAGMRYQSRLMDQQQSMGHAAQTLQNAMQNLNAVVASGGLDSLKFGGNNINEKAAAQNAGSVFGQNVMSAVGNRQSLIGSSPNITANMPWNQAVNSWMPNQQSNPSYQFLPQRTPINQTEFGTFGNVTNNQPGYNAPLQPLADFNNTAAQNNAWSQNILLSLLKNQMRTPATLGLTPQMPVGFGNMGNLYAAPFQNVLPTYTL